MRTTTEVNERATPIHGCGGSGHFFIQNTELELVILREREGKIHTHMLDSTFIFIY